MTPLRTQRRTGLRLALVGALTAALAIAFGLTGGISYAAKSVQGGTKVVTDLVAGPADNVHGNSPTSNNGNGNGSKPPGGNNPCAPSEHAVYDQNGSFVSCAHNGDASGNCGQNQGDQGGDHGYGNGTGCGTSSGGDQYGEKVLICHSTSSDTNPWVLIDVSVNAVPAHKAHGDTLPTANGTCPGPPIP